jgi:hypothetical protein
VEIAKGTGYLAELDGIERDLVIVGKQVMT